MRNKGKDIDYFLNGIVNGNRFILSEAITLVESTHPEKYELGLELISKLPAKQDNTIRIGITGSPGVGKSTFLDAFGMHLVEQGHNVAVLAIDPSSRKSKGSILGDKTRMANLSRNERAFIRPTASGLVLGGVAATTKEAILLCEASGYDIILIETVGVGQSETLVSSIVDVFLLLIMPGSGDEIQGIKRGIMELADILVVNKADGERISLAEKSKKQFESALSLIQEKVDGWTAKVLTCSALEPKGMDEIRLSILQFLKAAKENGYFHENRMDQDRMWFEEKARQIILDEIFRKKGNLDMIEQISLEIAGKRIFPVDALIKFKSSILSLI